MSDDEDLRGDVVAPALVACGVLRRLHRQRVQHDEDLRKEMVGGKRGDNPLADVTDFLSHCCAHT